MKGVTISIQAVNFIVLKNKSWMDEMRISSLCADGCFSLAVLKGVAEIRI